MKPSELWHLVTYHGISLSSQGLHQSSRWWKCLYSWSCFPLLRDETQRRKLVNLQSCSRLPSSGYHLRASDWFPLLFAVPGTHHCLVHRLPDTHPFFISCLPGGEGCARGGRPRRGDERGVWDLCRCPVVGPGESLSLKGSPGEVTWKLDC